MKSSLQGAFYYSQEMDSNLVLETVRNEQPTGCE